MSSPLNSLPEPHRAQRVRVIPLQVEVLDNGHLRISSPVARGWASVAKNPHQLAQSIQSAFTEVSVASYARWRNRPYDLDALTSHVPGDPLAGDAQQRIRGPRRVRKKSHNVADWTKLEDGRWRSPSGRTYGQDTRAVRNVVRKRVERGLPS